MLEELMRMRRNVHPMIMAGMRNKSIFRTARAATMGSIECCSSPTMAMASSLVPTGACAAFTSLSVPILLLWRRYHEVAMSN